MPFSNSSIMSDHTLDQLKLNSTESKNTISNNNTSNLDEKTQGQIPVLLSESNKTISHSNNNSITNQIIPQINNSNYTNENQNATISGSTILPSIQTSFIEMKPHYTNDFKTNLRAKASIII